MGFCIIDRELSRKGEVDHFTWTTTLHQPQLHLLQDSKQGELEKMLAEFKELFQEPVELPPL